MRGAPLLVLGCLGFAACHSTPEAPLRPLAELPAAAPVEGLPQIFEGALGFDELVDIGAPDGVQLGDSVLYRLTLHDGDEEREWWLQANLAYVLGIATLRGDWRTTAGAHYEVVEESPAYRAMVMVVERGSDEFLFSELAIPRISMERNLYTMARAIEPYLGAEGDLQADPAEGDWQHIVIGLASALALFNGWQANETLAGILQEVVGAPSLLGAVGALFKGKLELTLSLDVLNVRSEPAVLPAPIGELPGSWLPFKVSLGGDVLMFGELHSVAPAAPLNAGMGVVALRGAHPRDPDRWVRAELVGARRAK